MAEIYGTTWIETARDKLVAHFNALKTTMATGYTPTFSFVYEKHDTAKLELNAVSIGLESADSQNVGAGGSDKAVDYMMEFTVRVHTDYIDGIQDGQKNERLLNSVINKLKDNLDLGGQYRVDEITNITPTLEFTESGTLGGQFNVLVTIAVAHTQE